MKVGCDWVISIFYCSIVPASSCSLSSLHLYCSLAVVFFDYRHPCFRNFNPTVPFDAVGVKSFLDSFRDPTCVPVRISINKPTTIGNQGNMALFYMYRQEKKYKLISDKSSEVYHAL